MNVDQLLQLSVRIARAHESLESLRTELHQFGGSYQQLRMVDNATQALDTLSSTIRAQHQPVD